MDGAPDKDQWKRIKARVKEIDGAPITKTVFVDCYLPTYRPYWAHRLDVFGVGSAGASFSTGKSDAFESHGAMLDLGKAEYSSALSSRSTA